MFRQENQDLVSITFYHNDKQVVAELTNRIDHNALIELHYSHMNVHYIDSTPIYSGTVDTVEHFMDKIEEFKENGYIQEYYN